jgi:hypothetical protein
MSGQTAVLVPMVEAEAYCWWLPEAMQLFQKCSALLRRRVRSINHPSLVRLQQQQDKATSKAELLIHLPYQCFEILHLPFWA